MSYLLQICSAAAGSIRRKNGNTWAGKKYLQTYIPDAYPGIDRLIHRQKEEGGLVCVISRSGQENIARDYGVHFGIRPDAIYGWSRPTEQRKPSPIYHGPLRFEAIGNPGGG